MPLNQPHELVAHYRSHTIDGEAQCKARLAKLTLIHREFSTVLWLHVIITVGGCSIRCIWLWTCHL